MSSFFFSSLYLADVLARILLYRKGELDLRRGDWDRSTRREQRLQSKTAPSLRILTYFVLEQLEEGSILSKRENGGRSDKVAPRPFDSFKPISCKQLCYSEAKAF